MPRIAITLEEKALEYFIKEIQDEMNLSGLNYVYKNTLGDILFDSPASIRTHVKNRYAPRPIKNFISAHLDVFEELRVQKDQIIRLKTPKIHQIKEGQDDISDEEDLLGHNDTDASLEDLNSQSSTKNSDGSMEAANLTLNTVASSRGSTQSNIVAFTKSSLDSLAPSNSGIRTAKAKQNANSLLGDYDKYMENLNSIRAALETKAKSTCSNANSSASNTSSLNYTKSSATNASQSFNAAPTTSKPLASVRPQVQSQTFNPRRPLMSTAPFQAHTVSRPLVNTLPAQTASVNFPLMTTLPTFHTPVFGTPVHYLGDPLLAQALAASSINFFQANLVTQTQAQLQNTQHLINVLNANNSTAKTSRSRRSRNVTPKLLKTELNLTPQLPTLPKPINQNTCTVNASVNKQLDISDKHVVADDLNRTPNPTKPLSAINKNSLTSANQLNDQILPQLNFENLPKPFTKNQVNYIPSAQLPFQKLLSETNLTENKKNEWAIQDVTLGSFLGERPRPLSPESILPCPGQVNFVEGNYGIDDATAKLFNTFIATERFQILDFTSINHEDESCQTHSSGEILSKLFYQ